MSGPTRHRARVVVVTGEHARARALEQAAADDVVIDLDAMTAALRPAAAQASPAHLRHVALGAHAAALDRAERLREDVTVWLVHARPDARARARYLGRGYLLQIAPQDRCPLDALHRQRAAT